MAQKEVGLLQVRKGDSTELPVASTGDARGLEDGEIGFTKDDGRLYIGIPFSLNKTSSVAQEKRGSGQNVEIITEFTPKDILYGKKTFLLNSTTTEDTVITGIQTNDAFVFDYTVAYDDNSHEVGSFKFVNGIMPIVSQTFEGHYSSSIELYYEDLTSSIKIKFTPSISPTVRTDAIVSLTVKEF